MKYTIDYFIEKFSAIPDSEWCAGSLSSSGRHCALGHCGMNGYSHPTDECVSLLKIMGGEFDGEHTNWDVVWKINDMRSKYGRDPKNRILTRLTEIKFKQLADGEGN